MKLLLNLAVALLALAIFQSIYYYPQLPEVMVSHFSLAGEANGWSSKNGFFGLYLGIMMMIMFIFILVPRWTEKRKIFGDKLPHRESGLATESPQQTSFFLRQQFLIMGLVNIVFALDVAQMAILANLEPEPMISDKIFLSMLVYFMVFFAWLVHFFLHYRKSR
jgi:uncharacterized membrane protein